MSTCSTANLSAAFVPSFRSAGGVWSGRGYGAQNGGLAPLQGRGAFPPNTPYPGPVATAPNGITDPLGYRIAWTSPHSGGVQFVLTDGSVRFINQNIDSQVTWATSAATNDFNITVNRVYQNLFRRNDGNVVQDY